MLRGPEVYAVHGGNRSEPKVLTSDEVDRDPHLTFWFRLCVAMDEGWRQMRMLVEKSTREEVLEKYTGPSHTLSYSVLRTVPQQSPHTRRPT